MAAGCLASLALYVLMAILLIPDGAPFLGRWMRSDWPLY
jgi:hypothetical protein